MILALALALAVQSPSPDAQSAMAAYRSCVDRAAVRLERSGEAADIVAEAAVESCQDALRTLLNVEAGDDWRYARVLRERVNAAMMARAQSRIVSIRADRR